MERDEQQKQNKNVKFGKFAIEVEALDFSAVENGQKEL